MPGGLCHGRGGKRVDVIPELQGLQRIETGGWQAGLAGAAKQAPLDHDFYTVRRQAAGGHQALRGGVVGQARLLPGKMRQLAIEAVAAAGTQPVGAVVPRSAAAGSGIQVEFHRQLQVDGIAAVATAVQAVEFPYGTPRFPHRQVVRKQLHARFAVQEKMPQSLEIQTEAPAGARADGLEEGLRFPVQRPQPGETFLGKYR